MVICIQETRINLNHVVSYRRNGTNVNFTFVGAATTEDSNTASFQLNTADEAERVINKIDSIYDKMYSAATATPTNRRMVI